MEDSPGMLTNLPQPGASSNVEPQLDRAGVKAPAGQEI